MPVRNFNNIRNMSDIKNNKRRSRKQNIRKLTLKGGNNGRYAMPPSYYGNGNNGYHLSNSSALTPCSKQNAVSQGVLSASGALAGPNLFPMMGGNDKNKLNTNSISNIMKGGFTHDDKHNFDVGAIDDDEDEDDEDEDDEDDEDEDDEDELKAQRNMSGGKNKNNKYVKSPKSPKSSTSSKLLHKSKSHSKSKSANKYTSQSKSKSANKHKSHSNSKSQTKRKSYSKSKSQTKRNSHSKR